jgi:hypothetical protein
VFYLSVCLSIFSVCPSPHGRPVFEDVPRLKQEAELSAREDLLPVLAWLREVGVDAKVVVKRYPLVLRSSVLRCVLLGSVHHPSSAT